MILILQVIHSNIFLKEMCQKIQDGHHNWLCNIYIYSRNDIFL